MDVKDIKKKKLTYMIIGISVMVIAITGATFAYFTSSQTNNSAIGGNMANITFDLNVVKKTNVDETKGGLIPMTNAMVEKAISNDNTNGICVDNNNNPVCQIYKITVTNNSSASMFVDGYVTLTGGSGEPADYTASPTTMRWAQAFCTESNNSLSSCTTAGSSTARQTSTISWNALGTGTGHDTNEIKDSYNNVIGTGTISDNTYDIINTNYIRVSNHTGNNYNRDDDVTSALVFSQYLPANDNTNNDTGDSNTTYVDSQVYYIVVWLSENGHNQTAGSGGAKVPNNRDNFFNGSATFISSEGSKVTATFSGYNKTGDNNSQSTPKFTGTIYRNSTESLSIGGTIAQETKNGYCDIETSSGTQYDCFDTEQQCLSFLQENGYTDTDTCQSRTYTAGISSYETNSSNLNSIYYLKHTIENNIVTESYVEFVVTPAMAQANPGMTVGTYTLKGAGATSNGSGYNNDSPYYASNVNVLKQAFGENSGYCSSFTSSSRVRCGVSGLDAIASAYGYVAAGDVSVGCSVDADGYSHCYS